RSGIYDNEGEKVRYILSIFKLPMLPSDTPENIKDSFIKYIERKTKYHSTRLNGIKTWSVIAAYSETFLQQRTSKYESLQAFIPLSRVL
ncbi:MAG: hypothetical protein QGF09_05285, partial [Rhodospirillales bacterium]|nr:hypothetical protein [Rhodospirillales bacterium]